jgi:hypothetical protein
LDAIFRPLRILILAVRRCKIIHTAAADRREARQPHSAVGGARRLRYINTQRGGTYELLVGPAVRKEELGRSPFLANETI